MSRIALAVAALTLAPGLGAQVAVRGETVHTMAGAPIRDGIVVIGRNGKIEAVGPASQVNVPSGYRTLTAKVVTPGFVDAHTVVGLAGALNQPHDQDQLETSSPIQPHLRAFDAYNARETLVEYVRSMGVTTMHTGHGPGALVSGQTMVVKTRGDDIASVVIDSVAMIAMTLGPDVTRNFSPRSPGSRAKGIAMLRAEFVKAQDYAKKRKAATADKPVTRDLAQETLAEVLDGSVPAMITAHTVTEILAALRLQQEFGFKLVLDGAAEAPLVIPQIKAANVPVILHAAMVRPNGSARSASLETAKKLRDAGIPVALQSGFEGYVPKTRVVLFEAALLAANGLTPEQALSTITIDAARVIGMDQRVGSLERGKDGDVVLFDGDPLEYTTHVCGVLIEGQQVSTGCR